jgi:hypothetical protein
MSHFAISCAEYFTFTTEMSVIFHDYDSIQFNSIQFLFIYVQT